MRYESALQVIGFLKQVYGTPVPILRIAQNIDLSYQPTHKHVRTLEQLGVIETLKSGREVLCRLRASEATHVWLALLALAHRSLLLKDSGPMGEIAATLRRTVSQLTTAGLQSVAVREPTEDNEPEIILLVEDSARRSLLRRFRARCRSVHAKAQVVAVTCGELDEQLADPLERQDWVAHMSPLHGEQHFWAAVLPCDAVPDLEAV